MKTSVGLLLLMLSATSFAQPAPPAAAFGLDVRRFGAKGDGVTDDSAAIQRAIDSRPDGRVTIYFPSTGAAYLVTKTIAITKDRVNLWGDGAQTSVIMFRPAIASTLFRFAGGAKSLFQCSIQHLGLSSSGTLQKTAIEAIDVRGFTVDDIGIYPWKGGDSSVGVHLAGRELVRVMGSVINADMPIVISPNPNSFISLDHSHFQDLHLIAEAARPVITIESGVALTDITFDGAQAWVKGTYGLYWVDHDSKMISIGLTLANVRGEQSVDPNAYALYVSHHQHLYGLVITNFYGDLHQRGIFLANTLMATITNFLYPGHLEALNVSAKTNSHVVFVNSWLQQGASIATGSLPTTPVAGDGWVHGL